MVDVSPGGPWKGPKKNLKKFLNNEIKKIKKSAIYYNIYSYIY